MQNHDEIEHLKAVIRQVLEMAKQQGAMAAEAATSVDHGLSVSARLREVETLEYQCDQNIGVTVYFGQKKGTASSNDLSPESLLETVKAACSIARFASEDEYAGLPDEKHLAKQFPDLDLFHPWQLTAEQAIELTIECEAAALDYDAGINNSDGASLNSYHSIKAFGNSLGFLHGYQSTRHSLSCSVLAGSDDDMQRDYWYSITRSPKDLESPQAIGRQAAQRTLSRLNARTLSTRVCPVLFAPEVAVSLISALLFALSGNSLYRKASFLLDSLGQQILPDFVTIDEQPLLIGGLASAIYDAEGVATKARDIVKNGVITTYLLNSYAARKLGMETTGHAGGIHNITVEPTAGDFADMLKRLDTGLLVTELMGQGVNRVTGDYSRGATGFWVENGVIAYPVHEITIAGNLKTMFRDFVATGNDLDFRSNIRTGSILIGSMAIAGQ